MVAPVRSGVPPDIDSSDNLPWVSHSSEECEICLFISYLLGDILLQKDQGAYPYLFFTAVLADATHIYLFTFVFLYLCETIALMQTDVYCLLLYSLYLEE